MPFWRTEAARGYGETVVLRFRICADIKKLPQTARELSFFRNRLNLEPGPTSALESDIGHDKPSELIKGKANPRAEQAKAQRITE